MFFQEKMSSGHLTSVYGALDPTAYDPDVLDTELNETADDEWTTDRDVFFLIKDVFQNLFTKIKR